MTTIEVSGLSIYPVKSLSGLTLPSSQVDSFGLHQDRRWMVVDANRRFVTMRQQPTMCLIQASLTRYGIRLTADNMDNIEIVAPTLKDNVDLYSSVIVWQDHCEALDAGDDAANWLSQFLQIDCRLVFFPGSSVRLVDQNFARAGDKTAFSDGFPILLTSEASLEDLNSRLDSPIDMQRFRPNVVVRGCAPYEEDQWQAIRIGEISYRVVKPCSRCSIPNINPKSAERGQEPSRTLISYRRSEGKIYFGQNVIPDNQGNIKVGMSVEILKTF